MASRMGSGIRGSPRGLQWHAVLRVIDFIVSFCASSRVGVLGVAQSRKEPVSFSWTGQTNLSRTRPNDFSRTESANVEPEFARQVNQCAGHARYDAGSGQGGA